MKKQIMLAILIMLFLSNLSGNEYLTVRDVDYAWDDHPGTIEKTTISVKPKGIYTEYGMYYTFSTHGTPFNANASLEVNMEFKLPVEAEVTDMWLWVGEDIMRAEVMDKWTAQQVYDDIVDIRVDPAILKKVAPGEYKISIFPLMVELPRRIKITYIVPNNKVGDESLRISALPINIMNLSKTERSDLHILYWPEEGEQAPEFIEDVDFSLQTLNHEQLGTYYQLDVSDVKSLSSLNLKYGKPSPVSSFAGVYSDPFSNENFYQLEINPNEIFDINTPKKAVFLFDVVEDNISNFDIDNILPELKQTILSEFNNTDYFNIMFSGMVTGVVSNEWISADAETVEATFANLTSENFNNYTSLPTLLIDGISFIQGIQKGENEGSIVLITSSNSHGDLDQANALIDNFVALTENKIAIHIIDLDNTSSNMHNIGNIWFKGNEYLYFHLSTQTVGEVSSLRNRSYFEMLNSTLPLMSGYFSAIDIYTTMNSGFTFANYDLSSTSGMVYLDKPYKRIGKYTGELPLKVIASAQSPSGEYYNEEISITESDIVQTDSVSKTIWAGQYIRDMYSQDQTNMAISEIINRSIDDRILTNYTAMLALEPDDEHIPYLDDDEEGYLGIDEENMLDSLNYDLNLENYPNPFNPTTTISYKLNTDAHVNLSVFNTTGELVAVLSNENKDAGKHAIVFNGSSLASGIYFSTLSVNSKVACRKRMVLIK